MKFKEKNSVFHFVNVKEKEIYGIAIKNDNKNISEKISKIKYDNFKYEGRLFMGVDNFSEEELLDFIKVYNVTPNIIREIVIEMNRIYVTTDFDIKESLEYVMRYFSKNSLDFLRQKLIGDLGEALFIYHMNLNKIDYKIETRLDDDSLYDFKIANKFIEVKTTTKTSNQIHTTLNQMMESDNKKFIVVKYKKVHDEKNILDVYKLISPLNSLMLKKESFWKSINDEYEDLIKSVTVIIEKTECKIFNNERLPKIFLEQKNGMKECQITLDATDHNLLELKKENF